MEIQKRLDYVKLSIQRRLKKTDWSKLRVSHKPDRSIVTEYDLYISELIKNEFSNLGLNFYSEEDPEQFKFPLIILDPIDGTKEFARGIPECAVSFGIYYDAQFLDPRNYSWIYNPLTQEEIDSEASLSVSAGNSKSLVSRTEYQAQLHSGQKVTPVGSIAYKLMLLAKGKAQRVTSKRPKNIWDICAGTHILLKSGFRCLEDGRPISQIEERIYLPKLSWQRPS